MLPQRKGRAGRPLLHPLRMWGFSLATKKKVVLFFKAVKPLKTRENSFLSAQNAGNSLTHPPKTLAADNR